MKKLVVMLMISVLLLSACSGGGNTMLANKGAEAQPTALPEQTGDGEAQQTTGLSPTEAPQLPDPNKGSVGSWSQLYTRYAEGSSTMYDAFSEKVDDYSAIFYLIYGDIELSMTNAFFESSAASSTIMVFEFMGLKDTKYNQSGDTAVAEAYDEFNEANVKYQVKYTGGNAGEFSYYVGDELSQNVSICVTDEYWSKVYSDGDIQIRMVMYANGDIYMGVNQNGDNVISLLSDPAAPKNASFATGMDTWYGLVGGEYKNSQG